MQIKFTKVMPPQSLHETALRLQAINGLTIAELAQRNGVKMPSSNLHSKGFAGNLIERCLGADAKSRPEPDFTNLGLELKTVPVDENLIPIESTFICAAPLNGLRGLNFEQSNLYRKISLMLFVLLISAKGLPLAHRRIAGYCFWRPDAEQMLQMKRDWEELSELIITGHAAQITARIGKVIQMRPKAASGSVLTEAPGPDGKPILTRPRGFYFRREFTHRLLLRLLKK